MPEPFNNNDYWWNGGSSTGTGSTLGSFWNEVSGKSQQNEFEAQQAELARTFSSSEALKNRQWQEYMSNTALQRQVADARAAGINPASLNGDGASTPSGGVASTAQAHAAGGGNGGFLGLIGSVATAAIGKALMAKYMNTAMQAKQGYELPKLLAAVEKDTATAKKARAEAALKQEILGRMRSKDVKKASADHHVGESSMTDEDWEKFFKENGF